MQRKQGREIISTLFKLHVYVLWAVIFQLTPELPVNQDVTLAVNIAQRLCRDNCAEQRPHLDRHPYRTLLVVLTHAPRYDFHFTMERIPLAVAVEVDEHAHDLWPCV